MKPIRPGIWQTYAATALGCAAVTFCSWYFLAAPSLQLRTEERELQLQAFERHRELPKLTVQLTVLRHEAAAVHQAIDQTQVTLEGPTALNQRLAQLETLASACGLSLDEVHPGELIAGSHFQTVPIRLSGSASYRNCAQFLHRLHEGFADIGLKSIDLSAGGSAAKSGVGPFHLELIWYARKE